MLPGTRERKPPPASRRGSSHSEEEVSAKSQDSTYGPVPRLLHSFQNQTVPPPQARLGLLCPPGGQQLGPFSPWRVRLRSLTLTPLVLEFVRFFPTPLKKQVFSSFPFQQHSGRVPRGGLHSWCGRCWETHAGPPSQWWRKTYVYRRGIKGGLTHARKAVPNKAEE